MKNVALPASLSNCTAATAPPPAASCQVSTACTISPAPWHVLDGQEVHPLDMADDGNPHIASLTSRRRHALGKMMENVRVPPFEEFYRRIVTVCTDCSSASSGESEPRTRSRRHSCARFAHTATSATESSSARGLRRSPNGWPSTSTDARRSTEELYDETTWDSRPAHAELEHLAGQLPATERAAVVLRYGYDLDYEQIGAVLGSNAIAARQATSAGVRRLRKELR